MLIQEIDENKKRYLHLLLLADEQEDMVDRYLERGTMYVLDDNGVKAECIVTDEGNGVLEIKNIATLPDYQKQGYARKLIDFLVAKYSEQYSVLQVGTGDSPLTIPFYEKTKNTGIQDQGQSGCRDNWSEYTCAQTFRWKCTENSGGT